jgi:hypothetical protein
MVRQKTLFAVAILFIAGSGWRAFACEGRDVLFEDNFIDDAGGWAINRDVEVK